MLTQDDWLTEVTHHLNNTGAGMSSQRKGKNNYTVLVQSFGLVSARHGKQRERETRAREITKRKGSQYDREMEVKKLDPPGKIRQRN
jgi:hypothetical protein